MTVTPLHARSAHRPSPRRNVRRTISHTPGEWSLTIEITVHGDLDDEALGVLDDLQRLAARRPAPAPDADSMISINPESRSAVQGNRTLPLSRLEFDLLLFFAENPGRVFSREHLMARVWNSDRAMDRTVDVHIRRLRAKAGEAPLVTTVRGVGYRLADDARLMVLHN